VRLDCGFRADLIVEDAVIVEIKAVDRIAPIHQAQMLTYLRLSGSAFSARSALSAPKGFPPVVESPYGA
jgi:GxxExxY protein